MVFSNVEKEGTLKSTLVEFGLEEQWERKLNNTREVLSSLGHVSTPLSTLGQPSGTQFDMSVYIIPPGEEAENQ